jgi:hypothetical protein
MLCCINMNLGTVLRSSKHVLIPYEQLIVSKIYNQEQIRELVTGKKDISGKGN